MEAVEDIRGTMLRPPKDEKNMHPITRLPSSYKPLHTFHLKKDRSYQQQYGDMYFLRLTRIKPAVEKMAVEAWSDTVIGDEPTRRVERVLDVRQGDLCWVSGTVYMDMPLKPNILDDVSKDRWISGPTSTLRYVSGPEKDQVMLEDESGRIRLVGKVVQNMHLVTGIVIAALGTENVNGELEVIDIKFPGLAPQPERWKLSKTLVNGKPGVKSEDMEMADMGVDTAANSRSLAQGKKIAIISGLNFSGKGASHSLETSLLVDFLLGESLDPAMQREMAQISRLIIAGNSVRMPKTTGAPAAVAAGEHKKHKKYGYDASAYNPAPSKQLDVFLSEILPSLPVTLLPGAGDPANASFPQQPIHTAMFPRSRVYVPPPGAGDDDGGGGGGGGGGKDASKEAAWFDLVTNPWECEIEGWRFLGTGGQNVDDVVKYVGTDDRIDMMEAMCRWRCCAPTAPDTLWSYPFQDDDPFVIKTCPHVFFAGNQPEFATRLIREDENEEASGGGGGGGQTIRIIAVPSFEKTGEVVLVDAETLEVSCVNFAVGDGGGA